MSAVPATVGDRPPASGGGVAFWKRLRAGDEIAITITFLCAVTVILVTAVLVFELYRNSGLTRAKFGWSFLATSTWDPVSGQFGALPFIYGTLVTTALSMLIGIPLGVGAAVFLAEFAPPAISSALSFLIELLAAVPSVIIGLLGIFVMIPILQQVVPPIQDKLSWLPSWFTLFSGPFYGVSLFTAGLVLAIMILPFIISISREVILSVPNDQREGALALGATRWETTWNVVVPFARNGIAGSIFLGLARAMGETMAVTMVVGNDPKIPHSLLAPGYSIAAVIANEFSEATGDLYQNALIELGLVLFGVTILVNGAARLLVMSTERKGSSR